MHGFWGLWGHSGSSSILVVHGCWPVGQSWAQEPAQRPRFEQMLHKSQKHSDSRIEQMLHTSPAPHPGRSGEAPDCTCLWEIFGFWSRFRGAGSTFQCFDERERAGQGRKSLREERRPRGVPGDYQQDSQGRVTIIISVRVGPFILIIIRGMPLLLLII